MNIISLCLTFDVIFNLVIARIFVQFGNNCTRNGQKLHSTSPRSLRRLLLVQLLPNCTQMHAITYTNFPAKLPRDMISSLHYIFLYSRKPVFATYCKNGINSYSMEASGLFNDNSPLPRASSSRIGTVITDNLSKPWYNYYLYHTYYGNSHVIK